jgi:O-antigen/teichoic acid export membrane protein
VGEKSEPSVGRSNLAALVMTRGVQLLSGLIVSLALARVLPREEFGLYRWVWAVVSVATVGSTLGLHTLLTRRVAREPEAAAHLVPLGLAASGVLAVPTTLVIVGYVALRDPRPEVVITALLGALTLCGLAAEQMVAGVLHGLRRMSGEVWPVVAGRVVFLVGHLVALWLGLGLVPLYGVRVVAAALTVGLLVGHAAQAVGVRSWRVAPRELWELLGSGRAFGATVFFGAIYAQADLLLLEALRDEIEVARYAAPASVLLQLALVANIVSRGVYPRLAQLAAEPVAAGGLLVLQTRVLLVGAFPIAVGGAVVAADLIPWLFGEAYTDAVLPFLLLVLAVPVRFLNSGFGLALTALDRQRRRAQIDMAGAFLNVGANLLVIPTWGAEGAAVITLGTDLFLCAALRWELGRALPGVVLWRGAVPPLVASLFMAGVVWWAAPLHVAVRLVIGAVVFAAAARLLGAWTPQDLRELRRV